MGDRVTQKIVQSILRFLRSELETGTLSDDSTESLEVAIQCLESAYNYDATFSLHQASDLVEMFLNASDPLEVHDEYMEPVSEANKADAEKLKNTGNTLMKEDKYVEAINNYTSIRPKQPLHQKKNAYWTGVSGESTSCEVTI